MTAYVTVPPMRNGKLTDKEKLQAIWAEFREEEGRAQSLEELTAAYDRAMRRQTRLARTIERREQRHEPRPKKPDMRRVRAISKQIMSLTLAERAKLFDMLGVTQAMEQDRANWLALLQKRTMDLLGLYGTMKKTRNRKPGHSDVDAEIMRLRAEIMPDGKRRMWKSVVTLIRKRFPQFATISTKQVRARYSDAQHRMFGLLDGACPSLRVLHHALVSSPEGNSHV